MSTGSTGFSPRQEQFGTLAVKLMSRANTWLYRTSKGRLGSRFLRGAPVCMVAIYRDYDSYQARTERDIPVVLCEPRP